MEKFEDQDCGDPAMLSDERKLLLDRRCAELDANPSMALTWEQIKSRILSDG